MFFTGSAGSLSTAAFTLNGNTAGALSITGNLDLSTAFDRISFAATGTQNASTIPLLTYTGTLSGVFDASSNIPAGYSLNYSPGAISLVSAVPEPGMWADVLLGLSLLGFCFRRQLGQRLATKRQRACHMVAVVR